jgi:hypothetical protein
MGGLPTLTREQVRVPLLFTPLHCTVASHRLSALLARRYRLPGAQHACPTRPTTHARNQSSLATVNPPTTILTMVHQPPHANKSATDTPICMSALTQDT